MCNYVKIETGRNFPPVLKIVTHCAGCINVNVAKCTRDQCSIFSTGGKFRSDYGLLLELHAITLVARSYALLVSRMVFITQLTRRSHTCKLELDETVCEYHTILS